MSNSQERLADYLAHIVEAIDRISQYTGALDKASLFGRRSNATFPTCASAC
jgi:uncharacterized protein with HEPN domain